jgi:hypothetical protein
LKKIFGKSAMSKAYQGRSAPTPEMMKRSGLLAFKDLLKKYTPDPPPIQIDPKTDLAALP